MRPLLCAQGARLTNLRQVGGPALWSLSRSSKNLCMGLGSGRATCGAVHGIVWQPGRPPWTPKPHR